MYLHDGKFIVASLALVCATGCGPNLVPVEGVITLDGKALPEASIRLDRSTGPIAERTYIGESDVNGHYVLKLAGSSREGAVPDTYRVFITSVKVPPGADERTQLPKERVPAKYRDGSQMFEVSEVGSTEANFDLVSH